MSAQFGQEQFFGMGSEMAPGSSFGVLWGHFLVWARKLLREAGFELSGTIFWLGFGNGSGELLWSSFKRISSLGSEIAPGGLFGVLWDNFLA